MAHEVPDVLGRILDHCLELTDSEFGFVGLIDGSGRMMDVAAIKGFEPTDPTFYERFHVIPVRPNIFGVALRERTTSISNDVLNDPRRIGQPRGHPPVRTFLGVPLQVGDRVIGMIGVANRAGGYGKGDDRLLSTLANQAAVAIENAKLIEYQQEMIDKLENLNRELDEAEHAQVLQRDRRRVAERVRAEIERELFLIGQRISSVLENPDLGSEAMEHLIQARQIAARAGRTASDVSLTQRETQILRLLAQGHTNREIGAKVHLSENTVKTHVQTIFGKLSVKNRVEAAVKAADSNLI